MSAQPAYNPRDNWATFLQVAADCSFDELEEVRDFALKALDTSGEVGWAIPLGYSLWRFNLFEEALEALHKAKTYEQIDPQYNILIGMVARKIPGKLNIAKQAYFRALKLDPYRADIYYNYGNLIRDDTPSSSERAYLLSLKLDNSAHLSWHNLGLALNEQDRHAEAFKAFKKGLLINPKYSDGWCNAGLALFGLDQFERAIRYFRYTLEIDENSEAGHVNLGYALMNERRPIEALEFLKKGLELNRGSVNSIWNLSLIHLMLGNYKEGWDLYEARFGTEQFKETKWPTSGMKINSIEEINATPDNPLIIWSEQGMGDAIQFCRYLYLIKERGIPFIFCTRENLLDLMTNWLPFPENVVLEKTWNPEQDKRPQIALMSLPRLFKTDTHSVPSSCPYLMPTQNIPDRLVLNEAPGGIKVGFAWASNPDNKAMYRHKTMPPELLLPYLSKLVHLDLIDLHSLQVGSDANQLEKYNSYERVYNWDGKLENFSDTAFVINQLDLVISVDTAVAHLAGALGKPTWLLLPNNADFRWLLDSSDCPWYPSMKIFRQSTRGDWESVANEIMKAFEMLFALNIDGLAASKLKR